MNKYSTGTEPWPPIHSDRLSIQVAGSRTRCRGRIHRNGAGGTTSQTTVLVNDPGGTTSRSQRFNPIPVAGRLSTDCYLM